MTKTSNQNANSDDIKRVRKLSTIFKKALVNFKPPEDITVSEWADKYRVLPDTSSEPGPWRTSRTPYLQKPMDSFSDYKVHRVIVVAPSQVGKTELLLNILGYIMDNSPATTILLQPTLGQVKKFSKLRIDPFINDCKPIKKKVAAAKSKEGSNTILQKKFPGGQLILVGTKTPGDLASTPGKYVLVDERDRHATSAGKEGDPVELISARQSTFRDYKRFEVSSPTDKGASNIVESYEEGTQEIYCHLCPECGEWHEIRLKHIRYSFTEKKTKSGKTHYDVELHGFCCPNCGVISDEKTMRKQPQRWIAQNPDAYNDGVVSFWIPPFANPWKPWRNIVKRFLEVHKDPEKFKVFVNTVLGELWEDRGDIDDEDTMLSRREEYDAELPQGCLVLTCGVDTQDDRLEYEVVGYGRGKESWGIKKGVIIGKPDEDGVWEALDTVIDRVYKFENGRGLKVTITLVDSGGHYTKEVYKRCWQRQSKRVYAIKGKGGDSIPYVTTPKKVPIGPNSKHKCFLFILGVDSGKANIMASLRVQEPGSKYCHFPIDDLRGYDKSYFNGLLSEHLVLNKTSKGNTWHWEKITGHPRNEPLDIRNYANAGFEIANPDLDAIERKLFEPPKPKLIAPKPLKKRRNRQEYGGDW